MSRTGFVVFCCVFAFLKADSAQVPSGISGPGNAPTASSSNDRQIEVLLRSQFSVPPDYDIVFGAKSRSDTADFDTLPITFLHQGQKTTVNFLISKDGSVLARLEKFNIRENPALSIDVNDRPVRGSSSAKVEIINFDDLECPYCALLNSEILPKTLERYKGLIKIIYKDFPIEGHPWATRAAIDANCLASVSDSAYWSYVDYVHDHREEISGKQMDLSKSFQALDEIASKIGGQSKTVEPQLKICLNKQDQSIVDLSLGLAKKLGLEATPQVFVDGERLPAGARPTSELWPAIDRALKAHGIEPPSPGAGR